MAMDETVAKLMQISTPRQFKAQQYICYEGQPGTEMYVVLKGCVGIYVVSSINTLVEVARIGAGDFFGEMAIFDSLPRSASCIALEDTVCIAVKNEDLEKFIRNCPEMTGKLLQNMSGRIRKLNDEIYKSEKFTVNNSVPDFALPESYTFSHIVDEPAHNLEYTEAITAPCPICGRDVTAINIKSNIMSLRRIDSDRRLHFVECDPLWYYVWSCPYCHYSNHYLNFFRIMPFNREVIANVLKTQHVPVIMKNGHLNSTFDQLFLRYMQAIHINMIINSKNDLTIGNLWLYMHWLFNDAADPVMSAYCRDKATYYLLKAYDSKDNVISDDIAKQSIALTLTNLLIQAGRNNEASRLCNDAANYPDQNMRSEAYNIKNRYGFN